MGGCAITKKLTAKRRLKMLMEIFTRCGLVEVLVSDGGPALIAEMFKEFMITNIITQISLYQLTGRTYHKNG
jgi:hypothetical protein